MKYLFSLVAIAGLALNCLAVEPKTYDFAVTDGDTLRMDVYMPDDTVSAHPAVLFAFGGGFTSGTRNDKQYIEYFNFLADNGVVAISTDYRTSLAKDPKLLTSPEGLAQALSGAITEAVTDFYSATAYILVNAGELKVDPSKIFASGSSAGAITALQAEYGICNGQTTGIFPQGFNYAGTVCFAGAIFSVGSLSWSTEPCPMQLFHGDFDRNVPYSILSAYPYNFNGSKTVASSLADKAVPCEFFTFAGADHSIAVSPMTDNLYDILGFIKRVAAGKERLSINATVSKPGAALTSPPAFTIADYIKANM